MNNTWIKKEELAPGIFCYENIFQKEANLIDRLEKILSNNVEGNPFIWKDSKVGYDSLLENYRKCKDFKFKKEHFKNIKTKESKELFDIFEEVYNQKKIAVEDYTKQFNISNLEYWESFNFVKYGPGDHFQEHHDHGFSYNSTVSLIGYLNDDYEGGELYFRLQNLIIKPKAGSLYIFPSNYMYPHRAMPIKSGIKYAVVTMLDYNEKFHSNYFTKDIKMI